MTQDWSRMLDPQNTVMLLIDHQAGLMLFPTDIDPAKLRSNAIALAKTAKLHNLPVIRNGTEDYGRDGRAYAGSRFRHQ